MKRKYKIILISIFILIVILGILYWLFMKSMKSIDVPMTTNEYVIEFKELQEKVYIRAKAWGIGGNHEEIILATSPIENEHREYFKDKQFIFFTPELYYKKIGIDTLMLYVDYKSKIPENITTQIKIIQIELKDATGFKGNYRKNGLSKVSVYKKK